MNGLGTYRDDEDAEERDDVAERELHEQEAADREAEKGPHPFAHLSGPGLMARYLSGTVGDD